MRRGFLNSKDSSRRTNGGLSTSSGALSPPPPSSKVSETRAANQPTTSQNINAAHPKPSKAPLKLPCTPLAPELPNESITPWGPGPVHLKFPLPSSPGRLVIPLDLLSAIQRQYPVFPNPNRVFPEPRYRVNTSSVLNAGLGVFVTEDMDVGDIIMVEEPFLAGPASLQTAERLGPDGKREYDWVFRDTIKDLPESQQAIFWSLHNANPVSAFSDVGGIVNTNGLNISLRPGNPKFVGLGKDIVRINHSCTPNAVYAWSFYDWCWTVYAMVPIKKDEEVFMSYLPIGLPRTFLLDGLKKRYGMDPCQCPSCTQGSESQFSLSDANKIKILLFSMPKWYTTGGYTGKKDPELNEVIRRPGKNKENLARLIKESREWVDLVRKERCWDSGFQVLGLHGRRLVKGYLALGDEGKQKAVEVIKLLRAFELMWTGKEPGWTEVLDRMEETNWWMAAIGRR